MSGSEIVATATRSLDAVLAGMFVCASMMEHATRVLNGPQWIAYKQAKEAVFGPAMPVVFGAVLVVAVVAAAVIRAGGLVVSAALLGVVLVITVLVHVPLNRIFQSWSDQACPSDWDRKRRRWRNWNLARSALSLVALGSALAG